MEEGGDGRKLVWACLLLSHDLEEIFVSTPFLDVVLPVLPFTDLSSVLVLFAA